MDTTWQANIPWFHTLNLPRRAVISGLCEQIGWERLSRFTDFLLAVESRKYPHAAEMLRRTCWAHANPKKAVYLAYQMEVGEWQSC